MGEEGDCCRGNEEMGLLKRRKKEEKKKKGGSVRSCAMLDGPWEKRLGIPDGEEGGETSPSGDCRQGQ